MNTTATKLVCIKNKMNDKVITLVPKDSSEKQGRAQAWNFQRKPEQLFILSKVDSQCYVLRCTNQKGWVLDLHKQRQSIYTKIIGYEYHGKSNQKWRLLEDKNGNGWYFIVSNKSGYVLQIQGGIDADGMNIVQNDNYGNKNQLWKIEQV